MKKQFRGGICLLLILALLAGTAMAADVPEFTDVSPDSWSYLYVRACARAGLIDGVGDNRFAPNDPLTTEQLVTLVGRACYNGAVLYETTEADTWSSAYLRVSRDKGLLDNVNVSDVTAPVRRCDMAMLLYNVCTKIKGQTFDTASFGELLPTGYDTNVYAGAIGFCYSAGYLSGFEDGYFHGDDSVTRAQAAKIIAMLADLSLQPLSGENAQRVGATRLYVLMYHSVAANGTKCGPWTTTEGQLREDLQFLADHGYTTVLPSELANGVSLPERAVLITFDDGYADNYTRAFPLLREYGAKAVISPIVQRVDSSASGFLTWEMCREMLASGLIEIGSHTYDYHTEGIGRRSGESQSDYEARILPDIGKSKTLLEDKLGTRVCFFAYPHGTTDSWASSYLRQQFDVTVTTVSRTADISGGLYDLPRFNISYDEPVTKYLPA